MKKLMLWIVALAVMSGGALHAQDITGSWQGTLQAGKALRVVFKVSKADGNPSGMKAVMYSIDQPGQGIPVGTITLQGSTLKMAGRFDFTLLWTPDEFQFSGAGARGAPPTASGDTPPDIFTAFREQLGLKLEATKAQAEVFVIDRVEKPTLN